MALSYGLADISSASFKNQLKHDPVILLPLGSHEDHGPHLPMGDYVLADMLGARIAAAATAKGTSAFVAPALPFGVADYFGCSPGGLALSPAAFKAVLTDLLTGLLRHNLRKIIILNGHGGNVPIIHEVTLEVKNEWGLVIPSFYLWKIARQLMERRLGPGQTARFGHGAEPLMSLSLALRGPLAQASVTAPPPARLLGLPVKGFGCVEFQSVLVEVPAEFDAVPADARLAALPHASMDLGAAVAEDLVKLAADFVCHTAASAA